MTNRRPPQLDRATFAGRGAARPARGAPPAAPVASFWNLPLATLRTQLAVSGEGLSADEAQRRRARYGPNDPSPPHRYHALAELLRLFLNPLVIILLLASAVAAATGDRVGSLIVIAIVLVSVALDFVQTHRSQAAAQRLASMVATAATVRRDGAYVELPFDELVPGDVLKLGAGDLVPADCRLLQGRFLSVNEAALTGESLPVDKEAGDLPAAAAGPAGARNAVFLGSAVVSGAAEALVVNTGAGTELGRIGTSLAAKPPATEFQRGMQAFALLISRTVLLLVLFVFLVNAALGRSALESLLFAVALAVGLTPEFMPMIVTVTLAEAALRMAKRRVIVRHLPAIQNFGAIDVLCSDKTGTLTAGAVQVAATLAPFAPDPRALVRLARLNAALVSGLRNALDDAILRLPDEDGAGWEKVDELPFDFVRRRESVVVRDHAGRTLLVAKGAPESVLAVCATYDAGGGAATPLGAAERARVEALFREQSGLGCRSLAVAYRELPARVAYARADEADLCFAGLISFEDPPLAGAAETIAALQRDGVALKILTGDDPVIAARVCVKVGFAVGRVVTGPEVERLTDPALGAVAEEAALFARLTPMQKHRVIAALKRRGHVVGFFGDGINDAPSLHAADVGISAAGATDVAREAAEIILLEQRLDVLHDGLREGRKSFGNIMKYLMMATSSNFGNMFSMAGATLLLPFLPLLPVQILLNNLLYDLSQLTIPGDHVDPELTGRPRRWDMRQVREFMLVFGPISSVFDYLTFGVLWFGLHAQPELFRTGWFIESLATQVLVIYVIRTARAPWRSRPCRPLVLSTLGALLVGVALPLLPIAPLLGFGRLPAAFYLFLAVAVAVYLALVEAGKRWFYRRHPLPLPASERDDGAAR